MAEPFDRLSAYLTVDDGRSAIEFYQAAFGAEVLAQMPSDDGRVMHASLAINGGVLMLSDDIMEGGGGTYAPAKVGKTTVTIHIETDKPADAWHRAVQAGAEIVMPLETQFWGAQFGKVKDPFGHVWSIGGPGQ